MGTDARGLGFVSVESPPKTGGRVRQLIADYRFLYLLRQLRNCKPWRSRDLEQVEDVRMNQERAYQWVNQGNPTRPGRFRKFSIIN